MNKQEQKDFDKMVKAIYKHGKMVYNGKLPKACRLGSQHSHTVIIPTFKVIKEVKKFVAKYKGESCQTLKQSKRSSKK